MGRAVAGVAALTGAALGLGACAAPPLLPLYPDRSAVYLRFEPPERVADRLAPVPLRDAERQRRLEALLREAGCDGDALEIQAVGLSRYANVLCTLPGESDALVVVGGHFELPKYGHGVADNWAGVAMLPSLYRALRSVPRRHTFVFAGFAEARRLRKGSKHFLRRFDGEPRDRIRAMVALKAPGLGPTAVWSRSADPNLNLDLFSVSRSTGHPLRVVNFQREQQRISLESSPIYTDAEEFLRYGIPQIVIHSLDKQSGIILEQPHRDRAVEQLDLEAYYSTYRLVATYLAYLDETLSARALRYGPASRQAAPTPGPARDGVSEQRRRSPRRAPAPGATSPPFDRS